jgi:N-acetylneuraminic acid mutarotase
MFKNLSFLRLCVLNAIFYLFSFPLMAQWSTSALSEPRALVGGTYAMGKVFYAGGVKKTTPLVVTSSRVDIFDIATQTWTSHDLSKTRRSIAVAAVAGRVLFVGGDFNNAIFYRQVDIYDIASNTWIETELPEGLTDLTAVVSGNKAYFTGGFDGLFYLKKIHVYDATTNNWTTENLSTDRTLIGATAVGSKIIFAGGLDNSNMIVDKVDIYNGATNAWSTTQIVPARSGIQAVTVGDKAYFIGGWTGTVASKVINIYDNITGTWSSKNMSVARSSPGVAVLGDNIYIAGGAGSGGTTLYKSVEVFNTVTETFGTQEQLSIARSSLVGVSAPDQIFFAGGYKDATNPHNDVVDIRSAVSATFSPKVEKLNIFPSLATDVVLLTLPNITNNNGSVKNIQLIDVAGKQYNVSPDSQGNGQFRLNISQLSAGLYFIKCSDGDKYYTGQFVKM